MTGPRIAITGMAVRLSGASDLESFWNALARGRDPFAPLPYIRFDPAIFANELPNRRSVLGALVEDFSLDWRALRLPPAQVEHLHHVERLTLAVMGDALTDAGLRSNTGALEKGSIWMAASNLGPDPWLDPMPRIRRFELASHLDEALKSLIPDRANEIASVIDRVSDLAAPPLEPDVLMISACTAAGRASQIYDLRGGHVTIDVGVCSSLAAVKQALLSLQSGESDVALVCASAPLITPSNVLAFAHRGELGLARPRPFTTDAAGTLLGDGAIAMVLERHDDVVRKRVYATIEGVGCKTAPGTTGDDELTRCVAEAAGQALTQAGVTPERVSFIQSRAAGIAALDQAEMRGLARGYQRSTVNPTLLTSSVPTIGFLQAASGLAALASASLALHRRCWPAQPATDVAFEPLAGLQVPATAETWTGARFAAVSDAGPDPIAYHLILGDPRNTRAQARPARRVVNREPIAIVGAGVIAPGSDDIESFWRGVLDCSEQLSDLPSSRWDVDRLIGSSPELARAFRTRLACTANLPAIDAALLRMPPDDAESLDPAVLLAIGVTEQALRDAGHRRGVWAPDRVQIVFGQIALRANEIAAEKRVQYALLSALAGDALQEAGLDQRDVQAVLGEAQSRFDRENKRFSRITVDGLSGLASALRAAAAFGFSGEVISVDAACASSLAALKIASDGLRSGDADVAIAGGVSYHLLPEYYVGLGLLGALSTHAGRPFHRDADGFVPAEAAGAVVLKRLSDARKAGDRVYATIAGHGVSSDGHGLTIYSSNPAGQQLAMARALTAAGVEPTSIDLIEAHGPGAPLGDRAEMTSIAGTYARRPLLPALAIASAKSLMGHSSSAGAMLSIIRAALALTSKVFPSSAGNGDLAPDIPFGPTLELSRLSRPWVSVPGRPRRAAVNSFGMGGVNHHVILEEAESSRQDIPKTAIEHPASRPGTPLKADRFVLRQSAVTLPDRDPLYALQGRTLAVVGAVGPLYLELEQLCVTKGARLIPLTLPTQVSDQDVRAALRTELAAIDGVVDLSSAVGTTVPIASGNTSVWPQLKAYSDATFAILRTLYDRLASKQPNPACYLAITSFVKPANGGNSLAAFFQGIARALKQELPELICKAIDIDPETTPRRAAAAIVQELEDANDRVDVRISDRRYVATYRRANFSNATVMQRHLEPGDVFVFSGGGRGVVYRCAIALAQRGLHVVVTGRKPLPDPSIDWVKMTDAEFSEFRRTELIRRRGTQGPAQIIQLLDGLDLQRQASANIAAAHGAGLSLHYEACDITDLSSVCALSEKVRTRFGSITGVGHGAMIEHSATIPRKSSQVIEATLLTKVIGLTNLIEATRPDNPKVFVAFGSGVGRYGNSGQADYAAANALIAAELELRSNTTLRGTHCVTIDWPAWESLGATANTDIAELLRKAGVTSITPDEGVYWFLSELELGDAPEVVVFSERMLQTRPFLAHEADGHGKRAIELDDEGQPLLPSYWPMVDRSVQRSPELSVFEREISIERDLYMPQHVLNGLPVLPATFGCEMLAQGAALAHAGQYVQTIEDFRVQAPFALPRSSPQVARIVVRPSTHSNFTEPVVEMRSSLAARVNPTGADRLHHCARVKLGPSPAPSLGSHDFPRSSEVAHATSFYAAVIDPVRLGQLFFLPRWIQLFGDEAIGVIEPPDLRSMFAEFTSPRLITAPLVVDAALQIAGSWDGYRNGHISVPIGIDAVLLGRPPAPDEPTRAHARVLRIADPDVYYDISIVGSAAEVLVKLSGVHLRRIGKPSTR